MFSAPPRKLMFPLYNQLANEVASPEGDAYCELPVFPEDGDEKITVLFRLSLNEFVVLASAIDVGSDIAFGNDALKAWILWSNAYMCASFCEEMAQCFTDENEALMSAVAAAIRNNPSLRQSITDALEQEGGGTPGAPLSDEAAASDTLPDNVRDEFGDCILDNLWGGMLYSTQSGNRVIVDFFEIIEVASNTLESMEIVSRAIPAAGDYIATAAAFANKLQEFFAEAYTGAYTEAYEQSLSCDMFCAARAGCELSIDTILSVLNARLSAPLDIADFGEIMVGVASGTWVGDEIADVMFIIYFSALKFGQQFGDIIGIRPLTVIMSLGADQLSSDNWTILCDCPDVCIEPAWLPPTDAYLCGTVDQTDNLDGTWTVVFASQFSSGAHRMLQYEANQCCWNVLSVVYSMTPENLNNHYLCGANPPPEDVGQDSAVGFIPTGECTGGMLASSVSSAFTVTIVIEAC